MTLSLSWDRSRITAKASAVATHLDTAKGLKRKMVTNSFALASGPRWQQMIGVVSLIRESSSEIATHKHVIAQRARKEKKVVNSFTKNGSFPAILAGDGEGTSRVFSYSLLTAAQKFSRPQKRPYSPVCGDFEASGHRMATTVFGNVRKPVNGYFCTGDFYESAAQN